MTETTSDFSKRLHSSKALGFDFDGTLVDSNAIKRGAFDICFAEYPEHRDEIHNYCSHFNHTPRWEKFQYVTEKILKQPYTEGKAKTLHQRYEAATTEQVIRAPEIPGAMNFLRALPKCPILLLSSTPERILRYILKARRMDDLFSEIHGAPIDKAARLTDYKAAHGLKKKDVLFFGDTREDATAAQRAGWPFVAVANPDIRHEGIFYLPNYRSL